MLRLWRMNAERYPACKTFYEDSISIIDFLNSHITIDEVKTYIAIHSVLVILKSISMINKVG